MAVDDLFIENGLRHVDEDFLVFLEAIGAVQTRFEFVWKATTLTEEVEANETTQKRERERQRERETERERDRERERERETVAENVKTTSSGKSLKSI